MGNAEEALSLSCHSCSFVLGKKITFYCPHLPLNLFSCIFLHLSSIISAPETLSFQLFWWDVWVLGHVSNTQATYISRHTLPPVLQ